MGSDLNYLNFGILIWEKKEVKYISLPIQQIRFMWMRTEQSQTPVLHAAGERRGERAVSLPQSQRLESAVSQPPALEPSRAGLCSAAAEGGAGEEARPGVETVCGPCLLPSGSVGLRATAGRTILYPPWITSTLLYFHHLFSVFHLSFSKLSDLWGKIFTFEFYSLRNKQKFYV